MDNSFLEKYNPTIGVEFGSKMIDLEDFTKIKLQIWDTPGNEKYKSITHSYYKSSAVAVVVYDITSRDTFDAIREMLNEF